MGSGDLLVASRCWETIGTSWALLGLIESSTFKAPVVSLEEGTFGCIEFGTLFCQRVVCGGRLGSRSVSCMWIGSKGTPLWVQESVFFFKRLHESVYNHPSTSHQLLWQLGPILSVQSVCWDSHRKNSYGERVWGMPPAGFEEQNWKGGSQCRVERCSWLVSSGTNPRSQFSTFTCWGFGRGLFLPN